MPTRFSIQPLLLTLLLLSGSLCLKAQLPTPFYINAYQSQFNYRLLFATNQHSTFWIFPSDESLLKTELYQSAKSKGAIGIQMAYASEPLIELKVKQQKLSLNPSQLYTLKGLQSNLKQHNPNLSAAACKAVADSVYRSLKSLRAFMSSCACVINVCKSSGALTSTNKTLPADSVYWGQANNYNEVIRTNDLFMYQHLKAHHLNVLYHHKIYQHDGSLLAWAIENKISFCQVEIKNTNTVSELALFNKKEKKR